MLNRNGTTLIELMITVAIMAVIGLSLASIGQLIMDRYSDTRTRLEVEIMAARAEKILTEAFSAGIDYQFSGGTFASESFTLGSSTGLLRDNVNWDEIGDMTGDWATLALFLRESSTNAGTDVNISHLRKVGVWYRRPSRTTSGTIFITTADSAQPGGAGVALAPNFSSPGAEAFDTSRIAIENVSLLQMTKIQVPNLDKVSSLEFNIMFRYHPTLRNGTNWCPRIDIENNQSGCGSAGLGGPKATYRDVNRHFRIALQNTLLRPAGSTSGTVSSAFEERAMGSIYFFRTILPQQWN